MLQWVFECPKTSRTIWETQFTDLLCLLPLSCQQVRHKWMNLWGLIPAHPGLFDSKGLHLLILWSRCRAIFAFPTEVYRNSWLNWTVGSNFLVSYTKIQTGFALHFSLNLFYSLSTVSFSSFYLNHILLLYHTVSFKWNESMITVDNEW